MPKKLSGEKQRIAQNFAAAVSTYDKYTAIQRRNARELSARIAEFITPQYPIRRIVDLGCGTGFLSLELAACYTPGHFILCDTSAAMLDTAHTRLSQIAGITSEPLRADAEYFSYPHNVDVVASNFCAQWFQAPLVSLAHHIKHTRFLAWTMLIDGTFSSWKTALAEHGLTPGTPRFPTYAELEQSVARLACARSTVLRRQESSFYPSALEFLRELRAIGAQTARSAHQPQYLRNVLRAHQTSFRVEYEIATVLLEAA